MPHLGIAHLAVRKAHVLPGSAQQAVGIVGKEVISKRGISQNSGVTVFFRDIRPQRIAAPAVANNKNDRLFRRHRLYLQASPPFEKPEIRHSLKKNAENIEAERLNALTLLAAGVAHEIGNPLNSIGLHLQLLARKAKQLPPKYRTDMEELLKTAESETTRLDVILKQFLQAIRPTSPIREPYNIETILMEVLKLLEPEIQQRGIQINTDLQPSLPILSLDPVQIKQVQPDQECLPVHPSGGRHHSAQKRLYG